MLSFARKSGLIAVAAVVFVGSLAGSAAAAPIIKVAPSVHSNGYLNAGWYPYNYWNGYRPWPYPYPYYRPYPYPVYVPYATPVYAPSYPQDLDSYNLPAVPVPQAPPAPVAPAAAGPVAAPKNRAYIQVIVPDANAQVALDGQKTNDTGTNRVVMTPELASGVTYQYRVTASWNRAGRTITEVRKVEVAAGKFAVADFTRNPLAGSPEPLSAR